MSDRGGGSGLFNPARDAPFDLDLAGTGRCRVEYSTTCDLGGTAGADTPVLLINSNDLGGTAGASTWIPSFLTRHFDPFLWIVIVAFTLASMSPSICDLSVETPYYHCKHDPLTAHIPHGLGEPLPVPPVLSAVYLGHHLLQLVESGFGVAFHEMLRHAVPVLLRHLALRTPCLDLVQPVVHEQRALRWVAQEPRAIGPRGEYRLELKGLDFERAEWVDHGQSVSVGVDVSRVR